eukprot:CAMPEP_0194597658 /NCGR_PEP_ID=MMETSP0292-20121207/26495_1 /TAXON_ID=39354 /ORGANISM="Heterosigma akashiwo, Strain CCMP2393" /LENGTH=494 /DNA_ID=CAMNT_0039458371 /DNA_START=123 /DNA_END=1606 /DNA_ORIENTATION=-
MSLAAPIAANETTPCTNANGGGEKEALLLPPTGNSIDKRLVVAETESEHRTAPSYKRVKFYTEQSHYFQVDKKYEDCGFSTRAIHAGNEPDPVTGGVVPGLELSTTFAQPSPGVPATCFDYSRAGNPTRLALERNLAAMEGARFAVALSSGMAAITTVLHLLRTGDHVLCVDDVYGGTQRYLRRVLQPHSGIDVSLVDMSTPDQLRAALRPATKLVWLETPTNPTLKCFDIREVATVCRAAGALLVVDNTFMSPYLQNPLALGADLVVHSLTKYVGGHSDTLGGGVCLNDPALYERLAFLVKSMGTGLAPFDAWLALRGAKTLALRAERAAASALALARHLAAHRAVAAVLYPGLPQHPTHAAARRNGRPGGAAPGGGGGGVLAFRVEGAARAFLEGLRVVALAESLGGVESLAESPALMTHGSVPPAERAALGIDEGLVRLSVGVEDLADLQADLDQALAKAAAAAAAAVGNADAPPGDAQPAHGQPGEQEQG